MVYSRRAVFPIIAGMILILASCAPQDSGVPVTGQTDAPEEPTASSTLPPQVVLDAQQWLTTQLNLAAESARIIEFEQAEWTDSCLGLGRLNESCLQAITPGWRAVFEVNGVTYEVRTDETGSVFRLAPSGVSSENSLENTHWSLVSFGAPDSEQPPIEGSMITLMMANGQAGGYGGCNSYGGTYQVDGDTISFDEITSTLRACADENVTQQEQRYFQALESAARFERMDNFLVLSGEDGNELLTFETPVTVLPILPITTPE